ncbi:hypothetical protein Zmor_004398 [Zophobas morio]|jgi:hypothetical protein|uniref:Uncharacterized protein n=1 Tax=Zophobas morio TaxID=2755281 RepID=A0AA38LZQ6_9CUCU|nr:hypothetical protein Zmor_004398 [Zophobas morio]
MTSKKIIFMARTKLIDVVQRVLEDVRSAPVIIEYLVTIWSYIRYKGVRFSEKMNGRITANTYLDIIKDDLPRTFDWYDLNLDEMYCLSHCTIDASMAPNTVIPSASPTPQSLEIFMNGEFRLGIGNIGVSSC